MLCVPPPPQAETLPPSQRIAHEPCAYGAPLGTHRYPPTPGDVYNINLNPKNQMLKANINIASLNMNGFTAPASNMSGIEKWSSIYQTMNKNKIVILALQETHLDKTLLQSVHDCFRKRLTMINSQLATNPHTSVGVAFVINRSLVAPRELVSKELIKG